MNRTRYYLEGVYQNLWIAIGVLFTRWALGYELPPTEDQVELNTSFLILISIGMILGSLLFFFIFTRLSKRGVRSLYGILLFSPFLLYGLEVFTPFYQEGEVDIDLSVKIVIGLIVLSIGVLFTFTYIKGDTRYWIRNGGIVISAVFLARIMILFFDVWSIIVFAIVLSLFDIYSVFRGPISRVMGRPQKVTTPFILPSRNVMLTHFKKICQDGTPVLFSFQNTLLGIGDVLFFGVLLSFSLLVWGGLGFLLTFILITLGSSMTLSVLQRISPLPGLPFPVFLSLFGYLLLGVTIGL